MYSFSKNVFVRTVVEILFSLWTDELLIVINYRSVDIICDTAKEMTRYRPSLNKFMSSSYKMLCGVGFGPQDFRKFSNIFD